MPRSPSFPYSTTAVWLVAGTIAHDVSKTYHGRRAFAALWKELKWADNWDVLYAIDEVIEEQVDAPSDVKRTLKLIRAKVHRKFRWHPGQMNPFA
jgi:hypothetical protein